MRRRDYGSYYIYEPTRADPNPYTRRHNYSIRFNRFKFVRYVYRHLSRSWKALRVGACSFCLRRIYLASGERPESCRKCSKKPLSFKIVSSTSPTVLRIILDLACQIQCLTDYCLRTMIDRCMALELSHLLNPRFQYIRRLCGNTCPQRRPLGQRYQQKKSGHLLGSNKNGLAELSGVFSSSLI
jgi:hypothetical protein